MTEPPTGEVTFLFTDIEGSTLLWDQWPDMMEAALAEHDQRVRAIVDAWAGYVFTTAGDSFSIAFGSPTDAMSAAITMQLAMREPALGLDLRIRMGLHTGSASIRDGDYFGGALNRCAASRRRRTAARSCCRGRRRRSSQARFLMAWNWSTWACTVFATWQNPSASIS